MTDRYDVVVIGGGATGDRLTGVPLRDGTVVPREVLAVAPL